MVKGGTLRLEEVIVMAACAFFLVLLWILTSVTGDRSTGDRSTSKVQPSKALEEISVLFPAVTLDKEVHPAKAKSSTRTTDSGMSSEVSGRLPNRSHQSGDGHTPQRAATIEGPRLDLRDALGDGDRSQLCAIKKGTLPNLTNRVR